MENLKVGQRKEVVATVYGPGIVIIEETFMDCMGSEDAEVEFDETCLDDCYYKFHIDMEDEGIIFKLVSAEGLEDDEPFAPFKATLERIK